LRYQRLVFARVSVRHLIVLSSLGVLVSLLPRLERKDIACKTKDTACNTTSVFYDCKSCLFSYKLCLLWILASQKTILSREKTELVIEKTQLVIQPLKLWPKIKLTGYHNHFNKLFTPEISCSKIKNVFICIII